MTPLVGGTRSESYRLYALSGALLLAGPVWHYLYVNHYPARPELFLLIGGAAVAGALAAVVAHRVGGWVETVAFGLLLYLFIDLQFELDQQLRWPLMLALAIGLAALLKQRRAAITAITLGAFYLAALPRGGGSRGPHDVAARAVATGTATPASERPVLLHVILDEQWGVGGLRLEGDTATAAFLSDFYLRRGFELYPAAYSRYTRTVESIPALLSLGQPTSIDSTGPKHNAFALHAIPYFELLRSRGYVIRVFQNTYMDYCGASASPVASCETQPGNSIANFGYLGGSAATRALIVGRYFLNVNSHLYIRLHADPVVWRRSSAGGGLLALRHLRRAIETGPRSGVAYFVHVLLPHRPFELDGDCGVLRIPARGIGYYQPKRSSDSVWARTMALEDNQIRCTHRALAEVLDALDRRVGREHAIVIVHGDHGGRIWQKLPQFVAVHPLDDRQLNGGFSTLLAVRRAAEPAAVVADPVPVQDFVWRLARQDFEGPVSTEFEHFVRASRVDSIVADSVRVLAKASMPWSR